MTKLTFQWMAIFTLASVTAVQAALPQPDLIGRIYFAGSDRNAVAPNVGAFVNEFSSPEAVALRKQTADKLAPWLAGWLQKKLGAAVPDGAIRLRPLFDDLQSAEWLAEARSAAGGSPELALAIKLDNEQATTWRSALKLFFSAATFTTSNGWLIFASDAGAAKLGSELTQQISAQRPEWFSMDINWPLLAHWFPELGKLQLPETQFTLTTRGMDCLINGKFLFPQPLAITLDSWRFPTDLVHQPMASFTAVRGFASWLETQDWLQPYQITPAPNQAFIWTMQSVPFQTFLAEPVSDAADAVDQTYRRLQPLFSPTGLFNQGMMKVSIKETNHNISMTGMPMLAPFIRATKGASGQYLFAGGVPNSFQGRPLPPTFFHDLAASNLVFYHWENTAQRVPTMLQSSQFALLLTDHYQLGENSAALKWLRRITPMFGDNTTEITRVGPDQLAFTRTAAGIFTSTELFVLANWLEAKNFPGCDLRLPPFSPRPKHLPHPAPGAPPPAPTPH